MSVRGVAVAVSRRPQASMARRFRLHDGGTRRRLGNPCKQMQMHAGGSGDRNCAETHLLMGAAAATTERGRRRTNPATRQTRAFFALPGIPWLLHQCVEATIQGDSSLFFFFANSLCLFWYSSMNAHGKQHGIRLSTLEGFPCLVFFY